jgi:hypothetical protein
MYKKKIPLAVNSAVNSAALQDHLLRKYCLSGPSRSTSLSTHGRSILKKIPSKDSITRKQVLYKEKLTLAQRLGLISKPEAPLSHKEWSLVEKRSEQREEYKGSCPICQEKQGTQACVILSCSHVFHSSCLKSFEKFAKTKACPICRKASYDKKSYKTSENYYYLYCVVKVQSIIRCFIYRERFIRYMQSHPSSNLEVNRKYRSIHLKRFDVRFNKHLDHQEAQIDKLFSELETKLQASQAAVFELKSGFRNKPKEKHVNWDEVCEKAVSRSEKMCPICLQGLSLRETVILSCSHLFHAQCIQSFESYSISSPCCPVCRSDYVKKNINDC